MPDETNNQIESPSPSSENVLEVDPSYEIQKLREQLEHKENFIRKQQSKLDKITAQTMQSSTPQPITKAPQASEFEDYDKYLEALVEHKLQQKTGNVDAKLNEALQRARLEETQAQRIQKFDIEAQEFKKKAAPDFDDVARSDIMMSIYDRAQNGLRDILVGMDNGPQLAYYLGKNLDVAYKMGSMPVHQLVPELIKLSSKTNAPAMPTSSGAPTPVNPIKGATTPKDKNPDEMSTEEWRAWWKNRKG